MYENKIYIAGNPSYCISTFSSTITELKRFDSFSSFNRKLYACSDERGLTCLSTNSNSYIPCNFILPLETTFLTFSDECIGVLSHRVQMEWKCQRMRQLEKGITIKSGIKIGDNIILGDDAGQIYKI